MSIKDLDKDLSEKWQIYTSDEFYNKVHDLSLQLLYSKQKHRTLSNDLLLSIAHQVASFCVIQRMDNELQVKHWSSYIVLLNKHYSEYTLQNETSIGCFLVQKDNYNPDFFQSIETKEDLEDIEFFDRLEPSEYRKDCSISYILLKLYTKYSRYHPSTMEFKNGLLALISTIFYNRPIPVFSKEVDGYPILSKIIGSKLLFRLRGLLDENTDKLDNS